MLALSTLATFFGLALFWGGFGLLVLNMEITQQAIFASINCDTCGYVQLIEDSPNVKLWFGLAGVAGFFILWKIGKAYKDNWIWIGKMGRG